MATFDAEDVPCEETIRKKVRSMRFRVRKVVIKPQLSGPMMVKRLSFARVHVRKTVAWWKRVVVVDEKWFTELKFKAPTVLERPGSPLKKKFKGHDKETRTQLTKLMFLAAVSIDGKVGMHELDYSDYTKEDKNGKRRKGKVDSDFLKPFWLKIWNEAR